MILLFTNKSNQFQCNDDKVKLQQDLDLLGKWADAWQMKFNFTKYFRCCLSVSLWEQTVDIDSILLPVSDNREFSSAGNLIPIKWKRIWSDVSKADLLGQDLWKQLKE